MIETDSQGIRMRRQTILAAVSTLAIVAALAGGASAQDRQPLSVGDAVTGEIAEGDLTTFDSAIPYDAWMIEAQAGQRLEAIMRSDAFDAYLEILTGDDKGEPLAWDDDGSGEGTNARLRFTAPETGTYLLRARPLSAGGSGAYSLSLADRGPPAPAPDAQPIRVGETQTGEIASGDIEGDDGLAYDAWTFDGAANERVLIGVDSEAFDPIVRVGRIVDGAFEELGMNDDGSDSGLNARLTFTPPEAGTYELRAGPLRASGAGAYTVSLTEGPRPPVAQRIGLDDTVRGELTDEDARTEEGGPADAFSFTGQEGQRVRIDMSSTDFDTYLELFDQDRTSLATDDDGAGQGTNSRLVFTLPRDGTYIIEARPFSSANGDYTLTTSIVPPDRPPEPIAFGRELQGEIDEDDSRDGEDRGFDGFSFSGREGQRVQAIMRSGDFDTYLQIGRPDGEFAAIAQDDDGLGQGTDSRLNFVLPEDGDYVLRASPLGSAGEGLYSLELIDRGPQPQAGSLLVGSTARGTLTENDATADDNSFYDAYRVALKEDETLVIMMVSNEVDSFVTVGSVDDDGDVAGLATDDDSLSDTHARLEWTAPSDGEYEIRAGTFQQGQTGAYALIVEKKP